MEKFKVRQRQTYYEDFEVEANSPEEAIDKVNNGDGEETGRPEYLETVATYLLDEEGVFALKNQPYNAVGPDNQLAENAEFLEQ